MSNKINSRFSSNYKSDDVIIKEIYKVLSGNSMNKVLSILDTCRDEVLKVQYFFPELD